MRPSEGAPAVRPSASQQSSNPDAQDRPQSAQYARSAAAPSLLDVKVLPIEYDFSHHLRNHLSRERNPKERPQSAPSPLALAVPSTHRYRQQGQQQHRRPPPPPQPPRELRPQSSPKQSPASQPQLAVPIRRPSPRPELLAPHVQPIFERKAPLEHDEQQAMHLKMLRPFAAGHERVVEHPEMGYLQVLPPSSTQGRCDEATMAREYTHGGAAPWKPGLSAPTVCAPIASQQEPNENTMAIVKAVDEFNDRHRQCTAGAQSLLEKLSDGRGKDKSSTRASRDFGRALDVVRRNRFHVFEKYEPFAPKFERKEGRRRGRKRWSIDASIWAQRKTLGNSKDYYETDECLRAMFERDWHLAEHGHGLEKAILRSDEAGATWLDGDGNGTHDAVDATREALWKYRAIIYNAFDYYSLLLQDRRDKEWGEFDIWGIKLNAYHEFCRDGRIECDTCPVSQLGYIWAQVNALELDEDIRKLDRFNHPKSLARHEFLQALILIAISTYVGREHAGEASVSMAVDRLCSKLQATLPAEITVQSSNRFRRTRCYTAHVDLELRVWESSLRSLFRVYARTNQSVTDATQSSTLMSFGEFYRFLDHVGLLQMNQISLFGAKMLFKWSRIRTASDYSDASETRLRNLQFEDFLEALVRLACTIALPTEAEVHASGAFDAGAYLMALRVAQGSELEAFVQKHKVGWQNEPRQQVHVCVGHLASYIVRVVEATSTGVKDRKLIEDEVTEFEKVRGRGDDLGLLSNAASLLDGIRAAESIVRTELLKSLTKVEIFSGLDMEALAKLRDAMVDAPYEKGQYIMEQGDEGDSFYFITSGEVEVLREEEDGKMKLLQTLREGSFFGERALIKKQVRYASVCAKSRRVQTRCITRSGFEHALGHSLERFVPDKYLLDESEIYAALQRVDLLSNLSGLQLRALTKALHSAGEESFAKDEWIFEQGDDGERFYIITQGQAAVMHRSADTFQPFLLTALTDWHVFGERALLRDEPRYAGVKATSHLLKCVSISRDEFEALFGPLHAFLEDKYT
jgi:CRP-like cAMP-binding protein